MNLKLNKKDLIGVIEKIPDDLLENAYVFDWNSGGYTIQMYYNSSLLIKYKPEAILNDGYTEWIFVIDDKIKIKIIMT